MLLFFSFTFSELKVSVESTKCYLNVTNNDDQFDSVRNDASSENKIFTNVYMRIGKESFEKFLYLFIFEQKSSVRKFKVPKWLFTFVIFLWSFILFTVLFHIGNEENGKD